MIDEALRTMIDEVLICSRKIFGSTVEPRPIQAHLLVIPGRREALDPESRCKNVICFWIPGSLASLAPRNDE
jgi:hypothetical protein